MPLFRFGYLWYNLKFHAFRPFSIVPAVLKKITSDKGEGICVLPNWPTQSWYPSKGHEHANSTTNKAETTKAPVDHPQRSQLTAPSPRAAELTSVPLIRKHLTNTGVSAAAQDVIMASWGQGTTKQYKTFLAKWELFCGNNKLFPSQATVEDGIKFLTSLFNSGLGYCAINTVRSALSAVMNIRLTDKVSFCRFITGVFQLKPALPSKYTHIWDVENVLPYLKTQAPVTSLELKKLSLKLATVLVILTGQRCQTEN